MSYTVFSSSDISFNVLFVDSYSDITKLWGKRFVLIMPKNRWIIIIYLNYNNLNKLVEFLCNYYFKKKMTLAYFFVRNTWTTIRGCCFFCQIWVWFFDGFISKSFKYTLFLKAKKNHIELWQINLSLDILF